MVTLFVVVDPIGLAPTFLAVTEGLPRRAKHSVALRASIIAGAILIGLIVAEIVEQQERIKFPSVAEAEGAAQMHAGALDRGLGRDDALDGPDRHGGFLERGLDLGTVLFPSKHG